jgi:hypothetical protein
VLTRLRRSQADRCLQNAINALESPSLLVEWTSGAWDIRHHTGATICLQPVFVE